MSFIGSWVASVSGSGGVHASVYDLSGLFSAPISAFRVILITPANSNTIRVYLTEEPRHYSPLSSNDALYRLNWTVSILDGPGTIPVVETIDNVVPRPDVIVGFPNAWSVDLRVNQRILEATTYLTVASPNLVSALGNAMAVPPYDRDDHPGDMTPRPRVLQQPVSTRLGVDFNYDTFTGVFVLDPKQDFDVHSGLPALKKRILRRLLSSPGKFFHLPTYGVGLKEKELFNQTQLGQIRVKATKQIMEEEEVAKVSVDASRSPGVLILNIKVETRAGQAFSMVMEMSDDGAITVN